MKRLLQYTSIFDQCWEWTGSCNKHGYGRYAEEGSHVLAHRKSFELFVGPIPEGMQVLHRCDNPPCINPFHLFLGTHRDNMADMFAKGRGRRLAGEENPNSKLKYRDVLEIRSSILPRRELADRFGVSGQLIRLVQLGKVWKKTPKS